MGRPKQFDPDTAVERAMGVFWRKGYAATTPQDLVDEIGIGKGSLYNTFGSKHALFERALARYRDEQAAVLVALLEEPGRPPKERLRAALRMLVRIDTEDPHRRGCFAVNTATELATSDDRAADLVRRMFARSERAYRTAVEEAQRAGEIDSAKDPGVLAGLLLATAIGLRVMAKTADGPEQLWRIADAAVDAL